METQTFLAAMTSLQVLWLTARWYWGAVSDWQKIPLLLAYTVVVSVAIGCMPVGFVSRVRQFNEGLLQNEKLLILVLCVIVLITGAVYANYQLPYPDDVSHFDAARIVAVEGVVPFFADYAQIPWLGEQHPPLVPLIYGFAMRVLGVNLFVMRLISVVLSIATTVLTYFLGRELYNRATGFVAALLLLSFPLFLRVGASAMTDMPVTCSFALALLLTLRLLQTPTYRLSAALGLSIGAGLLSKYTMVFIYPVLGSYLATHGPFRRLKPHLGIVTLVSVSMMATWLVYAYHSGVLVAQRDTIAFYAGVVTTTDRGKWMMLESVLGRLPSGLGIYSIPMLFLGALQLMRRTRQSDLFVFLWIAVVFLSVTLTLPDARYYMLTFPALAIAMARGLRRIPEATEQAVMLALLHCGGALYLYADLRRVTHLFLR